MTIATSDIKEQANGENEANQALAEGEITH